MQYIVTGNEMKEYDNNTMTHQGISGLILMENAARAMFVKIMSLKILDKKILIKYCNISHFWLLTIYHRFFRLYWVYI